MRFFTCELATVKELYKELGILTKRKDSYGYVSS